MAKRRQNRNGTVYQSSENKWTACVMIGRDLNGKPVRKSFTAQTESGARKKLREYLKNNAGNVLGARATVSQYFEKEFLPFKKMVLKPTSYRRIESTYDTYIKPSIGNVELGFLTADILQNLIDDCSARKSYSSVKKVLDLMNACCNHNLKQPPQKRSLTYNPCAMVVINRTKTQEKQREIKCFTDDELRLIKEEIAREPESNAAPVYPYGALYLFVLNTGLRIGEALALDKSDFDLNNNTVRIYKNAIQCKDQDGGGYYVHIQNSLKTSSGNRVLMLNKTALQAAKELFDRFPDSEFFACNKYGNRVSPQNAEKTFKAIMRNAGVQANGRSCHALRHTFATALFRKGTDIKIVSQILGHSGTRITYDTYVSILQEQMALTVNSIPEI